MMIKRGRRWTLKKKKHEVTAIHWFLGQWDWNGLLLPSMCIVMVSICPLCVSSPLFLCLSAAKATKTGSNPFVPSFPPNPLFTLRLPLPCFPYFGMSMCYLLTLCMNDNMSVYSYRESYPTPHPVPGVDNNKVWMLYRFWFSVHLLFCLFFMYVKLKNNF